ncbi:hypothetical protein [Actinomadura bangladeshensis]|uniref:Membrane transport protein MMPL domain-containing protein n=1 Tax=Actinomadura bangladeshensis TaxID=453573 RepID=A0A6L9QEE0_9ACTN|nr:hypothetical protein [Actinomadura bangladeshensis]NEA23857.1 hypothetical protein [Actinomadura bangladeshensis]
MQDQTVDQAGRPGGGSGPALGVLAVAGALVPRFTDTLTGSSPAVDGSQSARAERLLSERFGGGVIEDLVVVFDSASRPVSDPQARGAVERGLAELRRQPGVARVRPLRNRRADLRRRTHRAGRRRVDGRRARAAEDRPPRSRTRWTAPPPARSPST